MTKKVAVINDLSSFGRCSLTAAISVLSAMGVQPCPLPTAILTAQTGYPSYFCDDYTDKMEIFRREWEKTGRRFDGIYTGFLAGEKQINHIFRFLETFQTKDTFLLADPVMGDDGKTHKLFCPGLLTQLKRLTKKADVITPNLTELCLLADADYEKLAGLTDARQLLETVETLAKGLREKGPSYVVVTGICFENSAGVKQVGNLCVSKNETFLDAYPYIGGSRYSGTGDLFASCLAAGMARGAQIRDLIRRAGAFIKASLIDSVEQGVAANDGVNYEKHLHMLFCDGDSDGLSDIP